MTKKLEQTDKPKSFTKSAFDRAEDVGILVARLHAATDQPVTISMPDWALLKRLGKLTMRTPHDKTVAFLNKIPIRKATS